ncbi:MAG: carboxypeptidase-like regulatory domain-containing protein, partial [Myxococcota bacterium]
PEPQREVEVDTVPDGELSIALEPGTEIRGRFVDDFQDVPVAGVRVAMQNDDLDRGARSDPEGGFVFEDVPAGRYRLRATAPQHLPLEIEIDLQRRSRGLYPIDLDVLRLLPAGSVRGTVVDPYGTAIAGAEVAIDESFTDAVRTDPPRGAFASRASPRASTRSSRGIRQRGSPRNSASRCGVSRRAPTWSFE